MLCKGILPLGTALLSAVSLHAQVSFTGQYLEDFDSLGPSGTVLPSGWSAVRIAGSGVLGADLTPGITAGTATGGGIYNTGSSGAPDRALGTLASSSTIPAFGLQLRNDSGAAIDGLSFGGIMEQWRTGGSATIDEIVSFEYSLNASSIGDAGALWTPLPSLNLPERLTSSTSGGAIDGNLAEHQQLLSGSVTGLDWGEAGILTVRWVDSDVTGSDGLYALDNFTIQAGVAPVPEPSTLGTLAAGLLLLGFKCWQRHRAAPTRR